jgi:hypothetical protein
MPKVVIKEDEFVDVDVRLFYIAASRGTKGADVSEKTLKRWQKAMRDFTKAQKEMSQVFNAGSEDSVV